MANDLKGVEILVKNSQGIVSGIEIIDTNAGLYIVDLERVDDVKRVVGWISFETMRNCIIKEM